MINIENTINFELEITTAALGRNYDRAAELIKAVAVDNPHKGLMLLNNGSKILPLKTGYVEAGYHKLIDSINDFYMNHVIPKQKMGYNAYVDMMTQITNRTLH